MKQNKRKAVLDTVKAVTILAMLFIAITLIFSGAENDSTLTLGLGFIIGFVAYVAGKRFTEDDRDAKERANEHRTMKELLDGQDRT